MLKRTCRVLATGSRAWPTSFRRRTSRGPVSQAELARSTRSRPTRHPMTRLSAPGAGKKRLFATTNCGKRGCTVASSHTNATKDTAARCARFDTRCSRCRLRARPGSRGRATAPGRTPGHMRKDDSSMLIRSTERPAGQAAARKRSSCSVAKAWEKSARRGFFRAKKRGRNPGPKSGPH